MPFRKLVETYFSVSYNISFICIVGLHGDKFYILNSFENFKIWEKACSCESDAKMELTVGI
jgi:hypothetical protein